MKILMKYLEYKTLVKLNQNSLHAGRKQNMNPEQLSNDTGKKYLVNFHFEHKWQDEQDVRMSVILEPGIKTAWLDVSQEEYQAIPQVELTELEWEAAVCVGTPRWVE